MYSVYILYAPEYDKYNIGHTNDLTMRLKRHNAGYSKFTSSYRPWNLLLSLEKETRSEAMILEKNLKNLSKDRVLKFIDKYRED